MKNIHVLSTDKPSRLYLTTHEYIFEEGYSLSTDECQNKHIYITSDEEIKKGDWFLLDMSHSTRPNEVHQMGDNNHKNWDWKEATQWFEQFSKLKNGQSI